MKAGTPVIGAIHSGYQSADGVDLTMFQPWQLIAACVRELTGVDCLPSAAETEVLQQLREMQGIGPACGICGQVDGLEHYLNQCPARFDTKTPILEEIWPVASSN